jgi:sortase A
MIRNLALMKSTKLKRRLRWLEAALYSTGVILLGVFFMIRAGSEGQRLDGIEAFQAEVESRQAAAPESIVNSVSVLPASPDQALWSEQRVAAYRQSMQTTAGPPLAVMSIDKVGIQVPVYNGTDDATLDRGVGRILGTARVGEAGNLGIAGHRDGFFRGLKDIMVGDRIQLKTVHGEIHYAVSSIDIVDPEDVSVLAPTVEDTITLVTCYPFYYVGHAPKRYIVKATAKHSLVKN